MIKFSLIEWFAAWRRNVKREKGTHSVMLKVYDNGRVVLEKEIATYLPIDERNDKLYIVGRINSYISQLYGLLLKQEKEFVRRMKKCGVK